MGHYVRAVMVDPTRNPSAFCLDRLMRRQYGAWDIKQETRGARISMVTRQSPMRALIVHEACGMRCIDRVETRLAVLDSSSALTPGECHFVSQRSFSPMVWNHCPSEPDARTVQLPSGDAKMGTSPIRAVPHETPL
jgi:hypothetical protein